MAADSALASIIRFFAISSCPKLLWRESRIVLPLNDESNWILSSLPSVPIIWLVIVALSSPVVIPLRDNLDRFAQCQHTVVAGVNVRVVRRIHS